MNIFGSERKKERKNKIGIACHEGVAFLGTRSVGVDAWIET